MKLNSDKTGTSLRKKISRRISQSEIPIIVYVVIFSSIALLWSLRAYNEDIALNFLAELFGAAFTLFIIDVLLVRSKTKRWKSVRDEVNYLISRNVNRLRDGISTRAFGFSPVIGQHFDEIQSLKIIREQRNEFLNGIASLSESELIKTLNKGEIFTENSYDYFNEKADEIWAILNIKYSDYIHPELVSMLINLHINLKDLCGHIRQYLKIDRFPNEKSYYIAIGIKGVSVSILKIIIILNRLKQEGYSEAASLINYEVK
ncbi:hypothetical protein BH23BAC1_BH23BAC1_45640 [soil metagenome]